MDLEVIPAFLLENDTGATDELASWGQVHFDAAMANAGEGHWLVFDAYAASLSNSALHR
jgi:hypothetical protein